jgi:hypothetical protein
MFDNIRRHLPSAASKGAIRHAGSDLPVPVPAGHVGPVSLPGTGRMVWWTGRVAIGLRHQPTARVDTLSQSAAWIQTLMLGTRQQPSRGA